MIEQARAQVAKEPVPGEGEVYLDNYSTTRTDPRVVQEMLPFFSQEYGNAHSRSHRFGWSAEAAVDAARERVAALVGASASEIVFTSGGTESCNLAIKGSAEMYAEKGRHLVTTQVEHRAVMDPVSALQRQGWEATQLPVDRTGLVDPGAVRAAIRDDTVLVSVIFGNNEIGTVQDVAAIGKVCKERGVLFHVDACVGLDTEVLHVGQAGIDLLSVSGHKIYGPKGVGALYVRRRGPKVRLRAQIDGGGQERGMRHGTLNVPGIAGLGRAAALCVEERDEDRARISALRDRLQRALQDGLEEVHLNGHPERRLPGALNLSFSFVEGESLMMGMRGICVSSGSACTSATLEPSHVMRALGVGEDLVHTSIRFSLGRFTTQDEVDRAAGQAIAAAGKLRAMSPLWEMWKEGVDLSAVRWKHD